MWRILIAALGAIALAAPALGQTASPMAFTSCDAVGASGALMIGWMSTWR